jgi:hypothetical protein
MRKILYSPGFGAGWSTWNSGEVAKFMLEYKPIIEALERGEKIFDNRHTDYNTKVTTGEAHPALLQLEKDCLEKFGEDYVCVLGADDLRVLEVEGRVRIGEYDGSESVEEEGSFSGWM